MHGLLSSLQVIKRNSPRMADTCSPQESASAVVNIRWLLQVVMLMHVNRFYQINDARWFSNFVGLINHHITIGKSCMEPGYCRNVKLQIFISRES